MHLLAKKQLMLATKHAKEKVVSPPFLKQLQAQVEVFAHDTDVFGTFTGEIPRQGSAYETCVAKATVAAHASKDKLGLASEGSFGPHPHLPLVALDHELMVLVDLNHEVVIASQLQSLKTNYQTLFLQSDTDVEPILAKIKFPSHAVCLQDAKSLTVIAKGITDKSLFDDIMQEGFKTYPTLLLSTDMRAMMNPSRMQVIGELAEQFALRLKHCCPNCDYPGFGIIKTSGALPCSLCHTPSSIYAHEVWGCARCQHQYEQPRQDGKYTVEPNYCNYCNP